MAKITASELKSILSSLSSYSKAAIFVLNKPYDLSDNFVTPSTDAAALPDMNGSKEIFFG